MLVWIGLRTVQNMVIGSGQYTLLSGRPVQTGPVLFKSKFTTAQSGFSAGRNFFRTASVRQLHKSFCTNILRMPYQVDKGYLFEIFLYEIRLPKKHTTLLHPCLNVDENENCPLKIQNLFQQISPKYSDFLTEFNFVFYGKISTKHKAGSRIKEVVFSLDFADLSIYSKESSFTTY